MQNAIKYQGFVIILQINLLFSLHIDNKYVSLHAI